MWLSDDPKIHKVMEPGGEPELINIVSQKPRENFNKEK